MKLDCVVFDIGLGSHLRSMYDKAKLSRVFSMPKALLTAMSSHRKI